MSFLRFLGGFAIWVFTATRVLVVVLVVAAMLFCTRYRFGVWITYSSATILEGGAVCHYWPRGSRPFAFVRQLRHGGWNHAINPALPFRWLPRVGQEERTNYRVAVVPLWTVLVPTLAPSAIFAWRRARRRARGECARCAYDLRGLPPGAPCPECGTPRPSAVSHAP